MVVAWCTHLHSVCVLLQCRFQNQCQCRLSLHGSDLLPPAIPDRKHQRFAYCTLHAQCALHCMHTVCNAMHKLHNVHSVIYMFHCTASSVRVPPCQIPRPTCYIHGSWGTWLGAMPPCQVPDPTCFHVSRGTRLLPPCKLNWHIWSVTDQLYFINLVCTMYIGVGL